MDIVIVLVLLLALEFQLSDYEDENDDEEDFEGKEESGVSMPDLADWSRHARMNRRDKETQSFC